MAPTVLIFVLVQAERQDAPTPDALKVGASLPLVAVNIH
jgi:hypothetical protein